MSYCVSRSSHATQTHTRRVNSTLPYNASRHDVVRPDCRMREYVSVVAGGSQSGSRLSSKPIPPPAALPLTCSSINAPPPANRPPASITALLHGCCSITLHLPTRSPLVTSATRQEKPLLTIKSTRVGR